MLEMHAVLCVGSGKMVVVSKAIDLWKGAEGLGQPVMYIKNTRKKKIMNE